MAGGRVKDPRIKAMLMRKRLVKNENFAYSHLSQSDRNGRMRAEKKGVRLDVEGVELFKPVAEGDNAVLAELYDVKW